MHARRFSVLLAVLVSGNATLATDVRGDPVELVSALSRDLCPLLVKKSPPADLPALVFPEDLELHAKNPTTSSKVMAFRKIKVFARGTEGTDRSVNRFVAVDVRTGKTLVDDKGLAEAASRCLAKNGKAGAIKWVDGQEAQLLATQPKVIFPTFVAKANGEMSRYGLEVGTQRLFLLDLPSGEAKLLDTVEGTTSTAPSVELLHGERYLKINPHRVTGEETAYTFANLKTGEILRVSAPPNQDLVVSTDGERILSAFARSYETKNPKNRVVAVRKGWGTGSADAPFSPLGKTGASFEGKVWSSSDDLSRHLVNLELSRQSGVAPRLKWVEIANGKAIQRNLRGWKAIQDQIAVLRKKGMRLDAIEPGKATFSANGRYVLVQLNFNYSAVEGTLPEKFAWSGVWDLEGKDGPRIVTSEDMKTLHELDIGPRPRRHDFFHDAITETHLTSDGTFIAVRAEPRDVGGGKAQIRVLVMRTSSDGVSETRAYASEPLDLDAVHHHGSTATGVHSLAIAPDGKTVSFQPTGNGSRVVKIVW